jgi:hypothetical protein
MSNTTVIIDKVFGLIDKLFNLFKLFVKFFILILIGSFLYSIYYIGTMDDKSKPQTCDTMAQDAQDAMKKRQKGVSLRDALNGVTDKDQSKIIAIVYDSPIYKDKAHQIFAIESIYNSTLAACIKAK